jgi:hypothetical protein
MSGALRTQSFDLYSVTVVDEKLLSESCLLTFMPYPILLALRTVPHWLCSAPLAGEIVQ